MIEIQSFSAAETERLGEEIAAYLKSGTVIAFTGDLATGKTTMIRGICQGLGVGQPIESPTYTLINEYCGRLPVYHLDCYRENRLAEWLELGINDYFYSHGVTLVEWADNIAPLIPDTALRIRLEHVLNPMDSRLILIEGAAPIEKQLATVVR
ncbi:MAG TPA: tRNA (adenosine(37)-N6)-threonylcarbamoyltransferase complex ATPase subunit type 1 TsaE [Candidatus Marinimicrobia bacterium]|nr:tRNA (adenosine(37)-N6)-threonylcarbamoyltransferase complex ATPase subunit type 1 TsaE [Candidatus Neomarinimicrobiota bacterium]